MRRADREVTDFQEIVNILDKCETIRLGLYNEPFPYIVPLSFGYTADSGKIAVYIHGAKEGLKHELIARCDRVCIEADKFYGFKTTSGSATTEYESVIGFGTASLAEGSEAVYGLDRILDHCGCQGLEYDEQLLEAAAVYRIELVSVSAKRCFVEDR